MSVGNKCLDVNEKLRSVNNQLTPPVVKTVMKRRLICCSLKKILVYVGVPLLIILAHKIEDNC